MKQLKNKIKFLFFVLKQQNITKIWLMKFEFLNEWYFKTSF